LDWETDEAHETIMPCPYGLLGDRLWVRETAIIAPAHFAGSENADLNNCTDSDGNGRIVQYIASNDNTEFASDYGLKKTPSIFMPRWASRITLEITGVRVERLQDISEFDARAEGVGLWCIPGYQKHGAKGEYDTVDLYSMLWKKINGADSWKLNPWVWVLEFKRVLP
jgi:hypothetical protein